MFFPRCIQNYDVRFPYMRIIAVIIMMLGLAATLSAQIDEKIVIAERVRGSITIDGLLNERDWQRAQPVNDFIQYDPDEGSDPTERSIVLVLYDDNALYIGAILYDSNPRGIVGQLSRRDRYTHADRFEVLIDSNNDKLTAYRFVVNVSNVQRDGIYSHDGVRYDGDWDAVWESSTARIGRGWSVEMRIPFTALRFDKRNGEYRWGINFRRFIARKNEEIHWIVVPRREEGLVSRFGMLRGMTDINPPLHVEVLPYIVSQGRRQSDGLPRVFRRDITGDVGVDVKMGLTSNTTLDLAINPDFGQVEIDQSVINLTAFETFYPEKRPFFLEGADLFRFGSTFDGRQMRLFYSRRIGRRPAQPDLRDLNPGWEFNEMPQATTILGATKLTSRTTDGLSVGVLSALTNSEEALIRTVEGDRLRIPVEPRGLYNVFRMRQEILSNSAVGVMATGVLRDGMSTAVSGGMDWNLRFRNNAYVVDGFVAGTRTAVNGHDREGSAGRLYISKPSGRHWLASANFDYFSRDFNPNDIGFIQRADYQGGFADLTFKDDYASGIIRRYWVKLLAASIWNIDGINLLKSSQFSFFSEYSNFWSSYAAYQFNESSYDDLETRGMGLYKRPEYHNLTAWLSSDRRKSIILFPTFDMRWADYGWTETYLFLDFDVRPSPSIEISPAVGWLRSRGYEAWFRNLTDPELGPISLFGDRDIDQIDFSLRGIVTLHPRLSIQFFTQVLMHKRWYENTSYLAAPDDLRPYDFEQTDLNYQGFNANIILRWEFVRGSTIYLVWTQERDGAHTDINQPIRDTFRDTFRTPMDNVFLIKLNYWFSV